MRVQWDAWHSAIAGSAAARQMVTSTLGLPVELDSNSLLSWDGIADYASVALRSQSANAVACIDAIQFADPPLTALRQCRRILVAGRRLAATAWEPVHPGDHRPPPGVRQMNLARDLARAGFEQVKVTEKPSWYQAERGLWEALADADARNDPGSATLAFFDARRAASSPSPPRQRLLSRTH
ncbi:MAG TPA: hypothetical protein VFE59_35355 [Trebonia sp.]|nr:hypothetical protein [Trebonia sp.]